MRKIETHDVFKMARIIKKAGIKGEFAKVFSESKALTDEETKSTKELGVEVIFRIIEACSGEELEAMLYDFVAGIAEKDAETIKRMSLDALIDTFKEMGKMNNLTTFFSTAGRLAQN